MYRIASHVFVTTAAAIGGLFYLGVIEGSIVYFDLIVGMVVGTFFLSLSADVTDTLRLLYLMEEESFKRRDDFIKYTNSVLSKNDQRCFIRDADKMFANKEFGVAIANLLKEQWKIVEEIKPPKKKKHSKDKNQTT